MPKTTGFTIYIVMTGASAKSVLYAYVYVLRIYITFHEKEGFNILSTTAISNAHSNGMNRRVYYCCKIILIVYTN